MHGLAAGEKKYQYLKESLSISNEAPACAV